MTPSLNRQSNETAPLLPNAPAYQSPSNGGRSTSSSSYTEFGESGLPHAENETRELGVTTNLNFSLFASLLGDSIPSK